MKQKENNKKCTCLGSIIPKPRYCGNELECIGVKKGDSFNTILEKINNSVCEGGYYQFLENQECENGGLVIKDKEDNIVYETCYPCCGETSSGYQFIDIDHIVGSDLPFGNTVNFETMSEISNVLPPDKVFVIPSNGFYRFTHQGLVTGDDHSGLFISLEINGIKPPTTFPSVLSEYSVLVANVSGNLPTVMLHKHLVAGDSVKICYLSHSNTGSFNFDTNRIITLEKLA